ncbi:hypothetical protein J6590_073615 [Homalodisca vitripennis]|nr:hypothetical protein J6590_073615 [Homalodisca vitripennis]
MLDHKVIECNLINQYRAWLLFGRVTTETSCPYKQPTYPAIGVCSEITISW